MACFGRSFPREVTDLILGMHDWEAAYRKRRDRIYWLIKSECKNLRDPDHFLTDFENYCLCKWDNEIPKGPARIDDPEWSEYMRAEFQDSDRDDSDTTWAIYEAWVRDGYGGERFYEES